MEALQFSHVMWLIHLEATNITYQALEGSGINDVVQEVTSLNQQVASKIYVSLTSAQSIRQLITNPDGFMGQLCSNLSGLKMTAVIWITSNMK